MEEGGRAVGEIDPRPHSCEGCRVKYVKSVAYVGHVTKIVTLD